MAKPFFRTLGNYDADAVSLETAVSVFEPTLTVQSEKNDCDINEIMRRFGRGIPLPVKTRPPLDVEWDQVSSYQDAMDLVVRARESFFEVPADVRARFHNNPQEFLDFFNDPVNYDEALRLGLVDARPDPVDESTGSGEQGEA